MPKRVQIESHFSSAELKRRYQTSTDPVELRRWHLIWLVNDGWTLTDAASVIGLNYHYAREIIQNYNHQGSEGIRNRRKKSCEPCDHDLS